MSKTIKLSTPTLFALDAFERAVVCLANAKQSGFSDDTITHLEASLLVARENLHRLLLQQQSRLKSTSRAAHQLKELNQC